MANREEVDPRSCKGSRLKTFSSSDRNNGATIDAREEAPAEAPKVRS
jgi:hypothetical protein